MEEIPKDEILELELTRRRRRRIVIVIVPAMLGFFLSTFGGPDVVYLLGGMFSLHEEATYILFRLLVILMYGASITGLALMYLQTGFMGNRSAELASIRYEMEGRQHGKDGGTAEAISMLDSKLSNRIEHLGSRLDEIAFSTHDITDAERTELINRLRESIEKAAKADFIKEIRASIAESQEHLKFGEELQSLYERTTGRLNQELRALTLRGNLNLALGSVTAIIGIIVLYFFVGDIKPPLGDIKPPLGDIKPPLGDIKPPPDIMAFTSTFLPRLSLVILVEVFAYFFLRLYSTSLMEIKYFQNEITNIEAKFLALQTAIHRKDGRAVAEVISQMAQTERNYILQKGQTTADLERSRIEKEAVTSLTRNLLRMFPRRS